jgi:hypothetical protein
MGGSLKEKGKRQKAKGKSLKVRKSESPKGAQALL